MILWFRIHSLPEKDPKSSVDRSKAKKPHNATDHTLLITSNLPGEIPFKKLGMKLPDLRHHPSASAQVLLPRCTTSVANPTIQNFLHQKHKSPS